jgi:hypothetical protein
VIGHLPEHFPPYYALDGGSHLHGFATRLPGMNLVFRTRTLKRASEALLREQGIDYEPFFREVPTDKLWNMNGITLAKWARIVRRSPLEPRLTQRVGFVDHKFSPHSGWRLAMRMPFYLAGEALANVPLLREAFCARVADVLVKP